MERSGWQRTWVRLLTTVLTLGVMVMIFLFSTEPAEQSNQTSGVISDRVVEILHPEYRTASPERRQAIYDEAQHLVRKTAHFTGYMLLGLAMRCCLESWFGRRKWLIPAAWAGGTVYAGTDELHQMLVDGRSGQWSDVLLDSSGVMTGVLLASLVITLAGRRRKEA